MKALPIITALLLGFGTGYFTVSRRLPTSPAATRIITHTDTIVVRDTVRITIGTPVAECPATRTVTVRDTIILPAVQRVYADTLYRAVVSGIDPKLDSLTIYPPLTTITRHTRPSPWGLGLTAGISITPRGITPSLTLGLTYTIRW
ncbi:MAG: hypothetical protein NC339_04085 [Muribaculaceae bacterium]|nr:hypothetical protein [Muribaculaceae bacterium]